MNHGSLFWAQPLKQKKHRKEGYGRFFSYVLPAAEASTHSKLKGDNLKLDNNYSKFNQHVYKVPGFHKFQFYVL